MKVLICIDSFPIYGFQWRLAMIVFSNSTKLPLCFDGADKCFKLVVGLCEYGIGLDLIVFT